jgi:hypothetical protein
MKNREDIDRQARRIVRNHQISVLKGLILKLEEEEKADGEAYAKLRQV